MVHTKGKKSLAFEVPVDYPVNGAEFRDEIAEFFQYLWNTKDSRAVMKKYSKIDKIKALLGGF